MRILKDSFIYLIGELFAKSLPFLMLPYLTRKLGPEGFGELSYYLTWLALFGIFIDSILEISLEISFKNIFLKL